MSWSAEGSDRAQWWIEGAMPCSSERGKVPTIRHGAREGSEADGWDAPKGSSEPQRPTCRSPTNSRQLGPPPAMFVEALLGALTPTRRRTMSCSELRRLLEDKSGVLRYATIDPEQAGEFVLTSSRRRPVSKRSSERPHHREAEYTRMAGRETTARKSMCSSEHGGNLDDVSTVPEPCDADFDLRSSSPRSDVDMRSRFIL